MKDELNLLQWHKAVGRAGQNLGLDPKLIALVQFLARRAAEADYDAVCQEKQECIRAVPEKDDRS